MSGSQFQHLWTSYLGGPGTMIDQLVALGYNAMGIGDPEPIRFEDIPVVSRFARSSTHGSSVRRDFHSVRDSLETAKVAMKNAEAAGPVAKGEAIKTYREIMSMEEMIKEVSKQKNKFSRLKKRIESHPSMDQWEKIQRVDEIQRKELKLMVRVNKKARALGYQF